MNTLWLIGWLITVGYVVKDEDREDMSFSDAFILLIVALLLSVVWPFTVGSVIRSKTKHP